MQFVWRDYDPDSMGYIESWLDESAVRSTGLEDGFRAFYEYWANEDGYHVGENFWSKVVFEGDKPFAVAAFGLYEGKIILMEIVEDPQQRGRGKGAKLLRELLENEEILGFTIQESEAVIFLGNLASQKAFEKAGFEYHHTHKDGDAVIYVYKRTTSNEK